MKILFKLLLIVSTLTFLPSISSAADRPNVLFIAVDDLRPELGCYGESHIKSPHLDRFAASARIFKRHYVQVPTCGASRYALLTGHRPTLPVHQSNDAIRNLLKADQEERATAFPQVFRDNGYHTVCTGKISHYPDGRIYSYEMQGDGRLEMPFSWDEVGLPAGQWTHGWPAFFGYASGEGRKRGQSPPFEAMDVEDEGYPDGLIANSAIETLRRMKNYDQPFLLSVGFFKPHLPFCAPKKYFDLYDPAEIELSLNPDKPKGTAPQSWHGSGEMFGNYKHPDGSRNDPAHHRNLRHAYYACVSYVDAQIGKVLDELETLGLADNTIIVVWGDHGWHLGDHNIWGKHTNLERAVRSALIVRTPNMNSPGQLTDAIVESVDLYPTLTDYCQLPKKGLTLDGLSLRPVLDNPQHPGKTAAFSAYRGGQTMRTDRYRLTIYPPNKKKPEAVELYDHETDPLETINVADKHPEVFKKLRVQFEERSPRYVR
jgi:arylsulfatase A-like enzyme